MNSEYYYVYVIIRADEYQGPECPVEYKVTAKEVVWDEDTAQREVRRLNSLGKEGVRYFSQVTRLAHPKAAPVAQLRASLPVGWISSQFIGATNTVAATASPIDITQLVGAQSLAKKLRGA
jgi:hypothetical protein